MGVEIEKKFLVTGDDWRKLADSQHYQQGYIHSGEGRTVRIRTIGERGILTIKGPNQDGARPEFEYDIPIEDGREMLDILCHKPLIEKIRHKVRWEGFVWEVDEFLGENLGLIFAEIELTARDQSFPIPPWIGREVTGDPRYYNACLVKNPYKIWKTD